MLDDGGEVDLDLGNYERFLDIRLTKDNNLNPDHSSFFSLFTSSVQMAKDVVKVKGSGEIQKVTNNYLSVSSCPVLQALILCYFFKNPKLPGRKL